MDPTPHLLATGSYTAATGGRGEGIALLTRDPATGRLGRVVATDPCDSPSFLASGPGGLVHAAHELDEGRVSTRRVDGTGWELLAEVAGGGPSSCHVAVHPGAEVLAVANYGGGLSLLDAPAGIPSALAQTLHAEGSGPVADRQEASHPHSATWLDAAHLLVCDLGTYELRVHTLVAGRLSADPVQVVALPAGTGPRHTALRSGGTRLHVVGELDATVTSFAVRAGRLSDPVRHPAAVAPAPGPVHPSEIAAAPWGLVVANRGADVLTLHEVVDGVARPVRDVPLGARNPRHLAVVGHHLYVAAQDSDQVVHLAVDADLTVRDRSVVEVGSPTCVLPLGDQA